VTLECVQALKLMGRQDLEILVIDNGSQDDSLSIFRGQEDLFRLISLGENLGFAAGNNHGLRLALAEGYDYALLVNNDAFAAPDMLANLLAEVDSQTALLSPKIYYESAPGMIWFANGRRQAYTLDLRDTGQGEQDGPDWAESRDVDYLLGTCLLVNLSAIREVGLLDERYFFYFEDLDWSIRCQQKGYKLRLVAPAHLYHRVALSTGGAEDTPLRRYYLAYGSVLFWREHAKLGNPLVIIAFRTLSALKMVARLTISGKWTVAKAYLQGLMDGWRASH